MMLAESKDGGGFSADFLRAIPKTDLHVHLDGSLRLETLIELAKEQGMELPADTCEGMRAAVFKPEYADLVEYLEGFRYTSGVMQTAAALERVAYEFAVDNFAEGVYYFEVRFAPQLHCNESLDVGGVLLSVNRGLQRARDEYNAKAGSDPLEPPREYGIIAAALRTFEPFMSSYYKAFCEAHKHEDKPRVLGLASRALVAATVACIDAEYAEGRQLPVVGVDIAGAEYGWEAELHKEAFDLAHYHNLCATVHAAEAFGPESLHQAVTRLHADRIGHGFHLFSHELVTAKRHGGGGDGEESEKKRKKYVDDLVRYVHQREVAFEVCPTSNLGTMPELKARGLGEHAGKRMVEEKLEVTICTDNRLVSSTTMVKELGLACKHWGLNPVQLRRIIKCGFHRSFFPGSHLEKQAYVDRAMRFFDAVAAKHGVVMGDEGEAAGAGCVAKKSRHG